MCISFVFAAICLFFVQRASPACDAKGAAVMATSVMGQIHKGTIGFPMSFAIAYQFINECITQTKNPLPLAEYDITINGDWSYLKALGTTGWRVKLSDELHAECKSVKDEVERTQCFHRVTKIQGCYVAWTGGFNNGKTTILNKITQRNFATGYSKKGETKGFNFILQKAQKKTDSTATHDDDDGWDGDAADDDAANGAFMHGVVHVDTPGATRAVRPQVLQDRFMTDRFVYDMLPDLADVVVLVVDILTSNEQVLIDELMEKIISFNRPGRQKELIVVHNFKTLSTKSDVNEYIVSDIRNAFTNAVRHKKKWKNQKGKETERVAFYTSSYKTHFRMTHFVFAQEHTEAGEHFNPIATEWLSLFTNDMQCSGQIVNVLEHFIERLQPLLRDYFHSEKITQANLIKPPFNPYNTMARAARWFGGFWTYDETQSKAHIKIRMDPNNDPFKLTFKPVVGQDDFVGIVALQKNRSLVYCNTEKIGSVPQCKPSIQCAVWSKPSLWGLQCILADADFSDSISTFNEDVKKKFFLLRDGCELIIYGTILPPWVSYVDDDDIDNFTLIHTDGMLHGWIEKRFQMSETVCINYKDGKEYQYKNGKLTITVPLAQDINAGAPNPGKKEL